MNKYVVYRYLATGNSLISVHHEYILYCTTVPKLAEITMMR